MLDAWLQDPGSCRACSGSTRRRCKQLTPEQLLDYFKERLKEQTEAHHGGAKWIGTGGHSPVGHSGYHPGGMRVGGVSRRQVGGEGGPGAPLQGLLPGGPLTQALMGEALKRLRHMVPAGPKDRVNVEATIYQTIKNAGEIEIVFDRALKDKLKVILAIDNGGWSMDPYIPLVQTLFDYARSQFKELKTFFFHNTIYDTLWGDPARFRKPQRIEEFARLDPETRLVIVGDASMAPYELLATDGSIYAEERSGQAEHRVPAFPGPKPFRAASGSTPSRSRSGTTPARILAIREIFPDVRAHHRRPGAGGHPSDEKMKPL